MTANIEYVVFDLGGVLIELDGPPVSTLDSNLSEQQVWQQWLDSTAVRRFESGACSPGEFAQSLIDEFCLNQTPETFLQYFEMWPKGVYPGADQLLITLGQRVRLACLSNTNQLHWKRFSTTNGLFEHFDQIFASFQTGHMKPDSKAFEHALSELDVGAGEILFLDDNIANIESARATGMCAELTRGPTEAALHLKRYGLL